MTPLDKYMAKQSRFYLYLIAFAFGSFWIGIIAITIGLIPVTPYLCTMILYAIFGFQLNIEPVFKYPCYFGISLIILSAIVMIFICSLRYYLLNKLSYVDFRTFTLLRFEQEILFGPSASKSIFDLADYIDTGIMGLYSAQII